MTTDAQLFALSGGLVVVTVLLVFMGLALNERINYALDRIRELERRMGMTAVGGKP